jgi:hypothetical protein
MTVKLGEAVVFRDRDGIPTPAFAAGAKLPSHASLVVDSPEEDINISLCQGKRRLASILVKSFSGAPGIIEGSVRICVAIDEYGHLDAEAENTASSLKLLTLCTTFESPTFEAEQVEELDESDQRFLAVALGHVEGSYFVSIFDPGTALPASGGFQVTTQEDDPRISFALLATAFEDLDAEEKQSFWDYGSYEVIADDLQQRWQFEILDDQRHPTEHRAYKVFVQVDENGLLSISAAEWETESLLPLSGPSREELTLPVTTEEWSDFDFRPSEDESQHPIAESPSGIREHQADREARRSSNNEDAIGAGQMLFVSHHSRADGEFAQGLVATLEAIGVQCWIAPRDIKPGTNWNHSIMRAVSECRSMIVLVSSASLESEFVQAEVQRALNLRKRVVPIILAPNLTYTDLDARLEVRQRVDWYIDPDHALNAIRTLLSA